jgi:hypothetical protein
VLKSRPWLNGVHARPRPRLCCLWDCYRLLRHSFKMRCNGKALRHHSRPSRTKSRTYAKRVDRWLSPLLRLLSSMVGPINVAVQVDGFHEVEPGVFVPKVVTKVPAPRQPFVFRDQAHLKVQIASCSGVVQCVCMHVHITSRVCAWFWCSQDEIRQLYEMFSSEDDGLLRVREFER